MKIKLIYLYFLSLFFLPVVQAQVTIGSDVEARKGILLDLKEDNKGGKLANSKKGLGLPRVALSALTTLTVDDNTKGNEYAGLTVYNTTNNSALREGTYCWFGNTWKQVILVDSLGADGKVLTSMGDNTYSWSKYTIPQYTYHKPTQTSTFNPSKAQAFAYKFGDIVRDNIPGGGTNGYTPVSGLFNNHFVYTETIDIKSELNVQKYMLLELTSSMYKKKVGDFPLETEFWEEFKIEVLIDNVVKKESLRMLSTPKAGNETSFINFFSVISLTGLTKGTHTMKIRISNTRNLYNANAKYVEESGFFFKDENQFLSIELKDFSMVLYEYE